MGEPDIFCTVNVFGILSGVVLCFFMSCYFLRKRRGKYEFISKETDFDESASEFSQEANNNDNKYGFHPINMAMRPQVSDDEVDAIKPAKDEQMPLQQNQSGSDNESSANDEYADASDEDLLPSKDNPEIAKNPNV